MGSDSSLHVSHNLTTPHRRSFYSLPLTGNRSDPGGIPGSSRKSPLPVPCSPHVGEFIACFPSFLCNVYHVVATSVRVSHRHRQDPNPPWSSLLIFLLSKIRHTVNVLLQSPELHQIRNLGAIGCILADSQESSTFPSVRRPSCDRLLFFTISDNIS